MADMQKYNIARYMTPSSLFCGPQTKRYGAQANPCSQREGRYLLSVVKVANSYQRPTKTFHKQTYRANATNKNEEILCALSFIQPMLS